MKERRNWTVWSDTRILGWVWASLGAWNSCGRHLRSETLPRSAAATLIWGSSENCSFKDAAAAFLPFLWAHAMACFWNDMFEVESYFGNNSLEVWQIKSFQQIQLITPNLNIAAPVSMAQLSLKNCQTQISWKILNLLECPNYLPVNFSSSLHILIFVWSKESVIFRL